ncbi:MAG: 4Fe-4S single cluster domain-containing protein [Desulfobacterales bacterium]
MQGCLRECPGCMTPDARALDGGTVMTVESIAEQVRSVPEAEGITVGGGEPFLQARNLPKLVKKIRDTRDMGVIVHTGFTLAELRKKIQAGEEYIRNLLELTDLLIDGPYVQELDDGRSLRSSANQKVHELTERYKGSADKYYGKPERNAELHLLENEIFLAGIPGAESLAWWQRKKIISLIPKEEFQP